MRVNMDSSILSDPRFKRLGKTLGVPFSQAVGACFFVWLACYERRSEKMDAMDIDAAADIDGFANAMLAVRIAHEDDDGGIIVHGVYERIAFLQKQRDKGSKGGNATTKGHKTRGNKAKAASAQADAQAGGVADAQADAPGAAQAYSPALALSPAPVLPPAPPPTPKDKIPEPKSAAKPPPAAKPAKPRKEPDGIHHEFIRVFMDAWFVKYGKEYTFAGGKDAGAITAIRGYCKDDIGKFRDAVANFFRDDSKFTIDARHTLGLLLSQWVRHSTGPPPGVIPIGNGGNVMDSFRATAEEFLRRGEHDAA